MQRDWISPAPEGPLAKMYLAFQARTSAPTEQVFSVASGMKVRKNSIVIE
jgi:hypothetical protein